MMEKHMVSYPFFDVGSQHAFATHMEEVTAVVAPESVFASAIRGQSKPLMHAVAFQNGIVVSLQRKNRTRNRSFHGLDGAAGQFTTQGEIGSYNRPEK